MGVMSTSVVRAATIGLNNATTTPRRHACRAGSEGWAGVSGWVAANASAKAGAVNSASQTSGAASTDCSGRYCAELHTLVLGTVLLQDISIRATQGQVAEGRLQLSVCFGHFVSPSFLV